MRDNSYVYILGNDRPTIYIGVTSNLVRRLTEHRCGSFDGFISKYGLTKLLYSEAYPSIEDVIAREKQLKGWHREWKLNLIRAMNPEFRDLSKGILEDPETSSG